MASSDWTVLTNSLSSGNVARGVSAGFPVPNGGGSFVYGFSSKINITGAVGLYCNLANFTPTAEGAIIDAALRKNGGGGSTDHSALLFLGLQGTDVASLGYLLGLSEDEPANLVLRKGAISGGLPGDVVGASGILAKSVATFSAQTWVHVQLEMVVNTSGDVVLNVRQNDLAANAVTAPSWASVEGMKDYTGGVEETAFIDDALGVNSGSLPYTGGRCGFAAHVSDINRTVLIDHLNLARQT